jgi:hypothetical protein
MVWQERCGMDSRLESTLLERNPQTDTREGWDPLRHRIAVPEPIFVQEMATVARARFGQALDRLASQAQVAVEQAVGDPVHWSAQPNYHVPGCPACAEPVRWDDATMH